MEKKNTTGLLEDLFRTKYVNLLSLLSVENEGLQLPLTAQKVLVFRKGMKSYSKGRTYFTK